MKTFSRVEIRDAARPAATSARRLLEEPGPEILVVLGPDHVPPRVVGARGRFSTDPTSAIPRRGLRPVPVGAGGPAPDPEVVDTALARAFCAGRPGRRRSDDPALVDDDARVQVSSTSERMWVERMTVLVLPSSRMMFRISPRFKVRSRPGGRLVQDQRISGRGGSPGQADALPEALESTATDRAHPVLDPALLGREQHLTVARLRPPDALTSAQKRRKPITVMSA